jgi:hypothetical protein
MTFDEILADKPVGVQRAARQLRTVVSDELPTATEVVAAGKAQYWIDQPSNVICALEPRNRHCLFFLHYVTNADSEVFNIEGLEAGTRYIGFAQELDRDAEDELRRLVHVAAMRAEAAG